MQRAEKRQMLRRRVLLPATIQFEDKNSVLSCTVKELSPDGARLKMASTCGVPERFALFIPALDEHLPCRIAWSTMQELGVAFVNPRAA